MGIVYPVHLTPNARVFVRHILAAQPKIHPMEPLHYEPVVHLMAHPKLILSDLGDIQDEVPLLGKPPLVMGETTERPETVEGGMALWREQTAIKSWPKPNTCSATEKSVAPWRRPVVLSEMVELWKEL